MPVFLLLSGGLGLLCQVVVSVAIGFLIFAALHSAMRHRKDESDGGNIDDLC